MNAVFLAIVCLAFGVAAVRQLAGVATDAQIMSAVAKVIIEDAQGAVTLAIGLVGMMTLFLGLMKVAEAGGLLSIIARLLRPLMQRLFPQVPPTHPAMGAMILNMSSNVLGLGNAATPFGIRAMQHLDALNPVKGTASNAMVLFLAINTSSVTLLPTGVIALRAAAGSADPASIFPTTLFATTCSTAVGIVSAKIFARVFRAPSPQPMSHPSPSPVDDPPGAEPADASGAYPGWVCAL